MNKKNNYFTEMNVHLFIKYLNKYGSDFYSFKKSKEFEAFEISELQRIYKCILLNMAKIKSNNKGELRKNLNRLLNIFRKDTKLYLKFENLEGTDSYIASKELEKDVTMKEIIQSYDYKYFLLGKLNIINEAITKISKSKNK
ncbi:hypothetical protein H312_02493 [Anncaliia algerae PRA339]|uniref:Uncharacterized protein n=1 Tax=Anncaliia algerae PRA339 TaxID=1288291 RepID=A0A059EZF7_9MICR|nr:hypothetical protein H312_02493 [Anncaliia algerae PRA339]